jgi:hypothetical protein
MTLSSASKRWVLLVTLLVYLSRGGEGHPSVKKPRMFAPGNGSDPLPWSNQGFPGKL